MILGAGIYQVPLIRTARRMGLYTIVVSIPGDYPGFALADKIYELNTRDKEAILAAAKKEQIDGICTSGTDVAVSTIGYVCEKMHLSGIPYEAAEILTDKAKMKDAFRQGGVSAADGMRVRSAEEAQKAAEQLGYPVVVKRVDSSGSRGITVVEHSGQIEEAYENARNGSAKISYAILKFYLIFLVSVFCFFKFFNRRSLSHTIHGIFLHMKLRPVLQFFLIIDKNAPVFYRWKICLHIRFFPAKFFFFFYRHICSVIPWGNACEAAEIIDYIKSSAPVSSFKTALACNIFCKSSARFRAAI